MGEKDMTQKTLEAFNDVFADIVNGLLFQGEHVISETSLTDAQPLSMYKADGKLHEQERDVAKYWNMAASACINVRIAFLGFENQRNTRRICRLDYSGMIVQRIGLNFPRMTDIRLLL